jgi:spermidine synthase
VRFVTKFANARRGRCVGAPEIIPPLMKTPKPALPEVNFSDHGDIRYLHLGTEWIQGSMHLDQPYEIQLEYVQRMMAWLLFVDPASVPRRHAMQLGLGAAALTKFCHKKLRMTTTAIELNPQVVAACRLWFKLPKDDTRLSVVLGDAAEVVAHEHWRGRIDALQVDLYDHEAAAPVLDSEAFYRDCRTLLTEDGAMTVNLFGRSSSYDRSLQRIQAAFGKDAVWAFKPTREGNTVVLALREPQRPARGELAARADVIESRYGLPARKWLRVFKPAG